MNDSVLLFPNILQPTATLKTIAPLGVKFWESQEAVLNGLRQYSEGWFARRQQGTHAALEAARKIGEAATPVDAFREYQDWLNGAMSRLIEDGNAYQQQVMNAGTKASANFSAEVESVAKSTSRTYEEQQNVG